MMIEVIDQYGERHRFDDNHCIHDADSATGMVQIGVSNDSGDYDVVATFLHPARFGEVSDDTCFTLRAVPAGIARQIEELRAENEKLKADAKYGWQAQELMLKNQALAAALVAKDEAIESAAMHVRPTCDDVYQALKEALALQPHAALVAKMKAEAVTEFLEREEKWTINETILAKIKADAKTEETDGEHGNFCDFPEAKLATAAYHRPTNQEALCEALARECERLATIRRGPLFPSWVRKESVAEYLETEAAAHRAKKGEVK